MYLYKMQSILLYKILTDEKKNKIDRVTDNTIDGKNLRVSDIELLSKVANFQPNETVLFLYCYDDTFDPKIVIDGNIFVGITDKRVFKIEKGGVYTVMRKDIINTRHIKNGMFSWDRIEFKLSNNQTDSFGIYHSATCQYFTNYLNTNNINEIR